MNKIEKSIYDFVKSNPALKTFIRNQYQNFFDLFPVNNSKTRFPLINKKGYFFGFHDHSPFSDNGKYLLAQKAPSKFFMPNTSNRLKIGFFSGTNFSCFNECTFTRTWNWHMGCKLQWLSKSNSFIYNDIYRGEAISKIIDIDTGNKKVLNCHLSSASKNAKYIIGYDFFLLEKYMPGYGYRDKNKVLNLNKDSMNIYVCEIASNKKKVICSVDDLKDINPDKSMDKAMHYITHGLFSPCSKKFCFLHRWITNKNDLRKRKSRLIICDIAGEKFTVLPTDGLFSHFCWRNKNQIVGYCNSKEFKSAYHLFTLNEKLSCIKVEKITSIIGDGHPFISKSGEYMVTDTYPNARRLQSLYLYNFKKKLTTLIGEFYMPKEFQSKSIKDHWCVDLHPRLNNFGNKVSFDNAFEGKRSLAVLDISALI